MVLLTPDSHDAVHRPALRHPGFGAESTFAKVDRRQRPLVRGGRAGDRRKRLKRIGFEKVAPSYEAYRRLKRAAAPGRIGLKPVGPVIEQLRMMKIAGGDRAHPTRVLHEFRGFRAPSGKSRPGMSETELAAELEYQMRRRGAEKPAFETIVASGTAHGPAARAASATGASAR